MAPSKKEWLLLIHQIPLKPSYLRIKIWRRLQQVGSVALKQSVYVLPKNEQSFEDFEWISKEITEGGGEFSLCEACFMEGLTDEQVISMFRAARKEDYDKIIREARILQDELSARQSPSAEAMVKLKSHLSKLHTRLNEVQAIDFFPPPERSTAEALLAGLDTEIKGAPRSQETIKRSLCELKGLTWVTRNNVFVDRIACGWLIKRFVDKKAKFKFVSSNQNISKPREVRFDMVEGEFSHEGNRCTFEVMVERLGIGEQALVPIAEIVHDLDLRDEKFHRVEAAGLGVLLNGVVMAHSSDRERLERGGELFNALYEYFQRQRRN